jgi:hypothetical protein
VTDWTCMHTGIDKAWSTERQHAAMLAARRTVQPALQLGVAVSYAEHWAGWPGATVWSCWHSVLFYLCCCTGLICDLCTGTGSQAQSTGRECCRQAARQSHQYLQCLQYQLCCTSAWSLLRTLAYGMHSRRKRLSGAGRQHSNPHARRRLDACGAGLSVSRNLQCWSAFTAGRNTVHDTTVPAAAVCNLLASAACLFWRIGPVKHCTVQPVH